MSYSGGYERRDSYDRGGYDGGRGYDDDRGRSPPRRYDDDDRGRSPPRRYDDDRYGGGRDRYDDRDTYRSTARHDRGNYRGDGRYGRSDYDGGRGGGYRRDRARSPPRSRGPMGPVKRENRIYCWNLSWRTEWQELKDFFREAGQVLYADVMKRRDGKSKGCGVVEFDDRASVLKAIDMLNNKELDGREVRVREDRAPEDIPRTRRRDRSPRREYRNRDYRRDERDERDGGRDGDRDGGADGDRDNAAPDNAGNQDDMATDNAASDKAGDAPNKEEEMNNDLDDYFAAKKDDEPKPE